MVPLVPRRGRPSLRRSTLVLANGITVDANGFFVDPLNMCRVCLCDKQQVYIDATGPDEPNLIQYVSEYYKVHVSNIIVHAYQTCRVYFVFVTYCIMVIASRLLPVFVQNLWTARCVQCYCPVVRRRVGIFLSFCHLP